MPISTAALGAAQLDRLIGSLAGEGAGGDAVAEFAADGRVTITFGPGRCTVSRSGDVNAIAAAADRAGLAAVQDAVGRYLGRPADGEPEISWSPPVAGGDLELIAPVLDDYLLRHCTGADSLLGELVVATRAATGDAAGMQVSADEGTLLTMLTRMAGARCAVEVGGAVAD